MILSNTTREQTVAENPNLKITEVAKLLGAQWGTLTDKQKVRFEKMAEQDKIRYQREMEDYEP